MFSKTTQSALKNCRQVTLYLPYDVKTVVCGGSEKSL